ncbi:hypothetical protein EDD21DRAFT_298992 [Dissophora ornata]|nr:hypothetical protein EDD21DRAFT_298992 [Dissophora ornata]
MKDPGNPKGDAVQRGVDFIGFEDSDNEEEIEGNDGGPPKHGNDKASLPNSQLGAHSLKRKRLADESSDEYVGPIAGPPPGCPWMGHRRYSEMATVPMMLTQELKDFVEYISPTREEHQIRRYVVRRIKQSVQELWSDVEVVVFGSFDTKLYLPSSDLDIVVLRDRGFERNDLYRLSRHIQNSGVACDVTVIAKARVPLVKFRETISGIAVDISFNITNGIQSGKVITKFMKENLALRPLTMLIKHFLMIKNHNEVYMGGLGSYTTVIMILSFLQMHPQIQMKKIKPEDNLGVLLIEFFELYGLCFNYAKAGISVVDGGSYFEKEISGSSIRTFGRGGGGPELLLTSMDPNDSENDTAKGSYGMRKIREVFVGAYGTLTDAVQRRNRELSSQHRSHTKSKRDSHIRFDEKNRVAADSIQKSSGLHGTAEVSLIKGVLSVPAQVFQHRQKIKQVFYDGTFQRMFNAPEGIQGLDILDEEEIQEVEPPQVVEYIHADDSEDDDDAHEKYFEEMMRHGIKEYADDNESGGRDKDNYAAGLAGRQNPDNVNGSVDSIQLPQLLSTPSTARNSSRNEQLASGSHG